MEVIQLKELMEEVEDRLKQVTYSIKEYKRISEKEECKKSTIGSSSVQMLIRIETALQNALEEELEKMKDLYAQNT